ncbi:MAG: bifunctional UDP-N-acetylglucosamine diphosphorylase/glucosamine-1-phosphate N-acetyltransferase GlmU [Pseudohongiellaceae bacterium]
MEAVILAAGRGTRMHSRLPKVLHTVGDKPMLIHVINSAESAGAKKIHVVVGNDGEQVKEQVRRFFIRNEVSWILQREQLGTAHAVQQAVPHFEPKAEGDHILVLYGDVPLIKPDTLVQLLSNTKTGSIGILTLLTENNRGLGRILRDKSKEIIGIVEEKDASELQKEIKEVNSGIMALPADRLAGWLGRIENNNQQSEYYLTDIIELAVSEKVAINSVVIPNEIEAQGVNDKSQLALVERHFQMTKCAELLEKGVILRDPSRVDIRGELTCGQDVEIDFNTLFEGNVTLGSNVKIGPNVIIKDSSIGNDTQILPGTIIESSIIGEETILGPNARIRPGTILGNKVKVGNFVETKKAILGEGTKANHLAYIGDAEIGKNCNIGAGTIFCNYDGANKHKTLLGDNVFIGSNSVLVAPVKLEDDSFVAAGSAVNTNIPKGNLAVGRTKQRNISGWKRPSKNTEN